MSITVRSIRDFIQDTRLPKIPEEKRTALSQYLMNSMTNATMARRTSMIKN
jgi:hypothetical protein